MDQQNQNNLDETSDQFAQNQIKRAVNDNFRSNTDAPTRPATKEYEEMEGSVMNKSTTEEPQAPTQTTEIAQEPQVPAEIPQYQQEYQPEYSQNYPSSDTTQQPSYDGYNQYQQMSISPDTVSEVAEQVVSESIRPIVKNVEKLIDSNMLLEAQIRNLDERMKRIEKITDTLQLSLMQKVGEYVNNISDIKTELIETQKTFKAMISQKDKR